MQFVEPIRDRKKIEEIKKKLRNVGKIRNVLLFELWINSALRISDLLSVRVCHLFDYHGIPKNSFIIKESKTTKTHEVTITPKVQKTLLEYKITYPFILMNQNNYIFFNQKKHPLGIQSINRKMGRSLISSWCRQAWLEWNHWGHTLRKTRWYHARIANISMEIIQHKLNHSSLAVTKRYLGITADEIEAACRKLDL